MQEKTKQKSRFSNPVINGMLKKTKDVVADNDNHVTYSGVSKKCAFYLIVAILGFVVELLLNSILPDTITLESDGNVVNLSMTVVLIGVISIVVFIVISIISIFAYKAITVLGFISMACMGFMLGFIGCAVPNLKSAMLLAVVITIGLFLAMLILYNTGLIKVSSKFKKVILMLVGGMIVSSLFLLICSLVPSLRIISNAFLANPVISIVCSVIGLVIATLFLISDFDSIHNAVENKLPKQYEWLCAYSLAFSIMWVFLKVFQLIARLKGSGSNSRSF